MTYEITCSKIMASRLRKFLNLHGCIEDEYPLSNHHAMPENKDKYLFRFFCRDSHLADTDFRQHGALTVYCEQPYIRGLHGE